ncbi:MAG: signal peptidase I [Myxococcales bacterium]|nr:signal peptidase I [Myxococcales bacterium]
MDRAVRKEAQVLVKQASGLLDARKRRSPRQDELRSTTADTVAALDRGDPRAVRQLLPALDGLIDELAEPAGKSILREYAESISIAIVIALVLRAFVVEAFKIPSSSMYPTLEIGDHIFVSKFIYGVRIPMSDAKIFQVRGPRRGEVAVFLWPCNHDKDFIKRIVALEGDTVEVRCNVLHVNGQPVPAPIVNLHDSFYDNDESGNSILRWSATARSWARSPTTRSSSSRTRASSPGCTTACSIRRPAPGRAMWIQSVRPR